MQIIGNLGRDPEMRFTQGGTPVTNFSVAVSRSWQSRDGEQREETEWFRVVAWTRLAEIANEYLRRGSKVYVEGRLATRTWQDREGNDRTTTELVAQEMTTLASAAASLAAILADKAPDARRCRTTKSAPMTCRSNGA